MGKIFKASSISLMCFMLITSAVPAYAASDDAVTKDFYFEAESEDNLTYTPDEEEIEIDEKHYRLKDVSCEIYSQPISEKKSLKSKNKDAEPYITKTVEGTEFKLYAPANIEWTDNETEVKQEFKTEAEAPETITTDDNKELTLKSVEPVSRTDNVSTTAKFYSEDPETEEYIFNGKTVYLQDGEPKWSGYKDDYASYLGIKNNNDYSITGSRWSGKAKKTSNGYVRTATVYGTKKVNYVIATYGLKDSDARYTADVTYTSKYIAHAAVTYERYLTLKEKIMYAGAGVGVLALAAAAILFVLGKRKKKEEE